MKILKQFTKFEGNFDSMMEKHQTNINRNLDEEIENLAKDLKKKFEDSQVIKDIVKNIEKNLEKFKQSHDGSAKQSDIYLKHISGWFSLICR